MRGEGVQIEITILSEGEIRESEKLDGIAIEAVAEGFTKLAEGKVSLPPILRVMIMTGEVHGNLSDMDVNDTLMRFFLTSFVRMTIHVSVP